MQHLRQIYDKNASPPPTLSGILLHLMVGRIITTIVQKGNKRREKQVDIDFSIYIIYCPLSVTN